MSNPTELLDLDKIEEQVRRAYMADARFVAFLQPGTILDIIQLARRAQPEGGAPQAEPEQPNGGMHDSIFVRVWGDAGGGDAGRRKLADYAYALGKRASATLSPLCGVQHAVPEAYRKVLAMPEGPAIIGPAAQHAESGKEAVLSDQDRLILQKATLDGVRLDIQYYLRTGDRSSLELALAQIGDYAPLPSAAQLDGGQEGSESNG